MNESKGIDKGLAVILEKSHSEELEYDFVMDCLKKYSNPRVKLSHLLKLGALIRVKKGIYIFGDRFARRPYSPEVLANMIYGPSYVSLEWACQYYRLIPEKVTIVTSVTTKRSKSFDTPIGLFTYEHIHQKSYPLSMTLVQFSEKQQALVATKEKALIDLLIVRRGFFSSTKQLQHTLFEDLRVERSDLESFNISEIEKIYKGYPHKTIFHLIQLLKKKGESVE